MDDVIGQAAWNKMALHSGRQCTATNRAGERCKRAPIVGGFVCDIHGGKIPAVRQSARERLLAMVDPALDALLRALQTGPPCEHCGRSDADRDPVVLRAAQLVLDRAGFHPTIAVAAQSSGPDLSHLTLSELAESRHAPVVAVASHLDPEILIIDEVLAVGDAAFQKKCLGRMDSVARAGRTVLFVSHNTAAIQSLCRKAMLLEKGRLVSMGPTREVMEEYILQGERHALLWERSDSPHPDLIACFKKAQLTNMQGIPLEYVTTNQAVRVIVELEMLKPCWNLRISVNIHDSAGGVIFASGPHDAGVDMPTKPGRYLATMEIPAGLLLPKLYSLSASAWATSAGMFEDIHCFYLAVQEGAIENQTPEWRTGVVHVPCRWMVQDC